jgi:hypothetical protein
MKLVKLNTTLIQQSQQPDHTNPNFNTSFHPHSAAPDLIRASETPYAFKRWLPLILRTRQAQAQNTPPPAPLSPTPTRTGTHTKTRPATNLPTPPSPLLQTIRLTRPQTTLLLAATEASLPRLEVNRLFREDLAEELVPLLEARLTFPPEGLFLRLDACSPKDGAGPAVLRSVAEVVGKVVTSVRARNAMVRWVGGWGSAAAGEGAAEEGEEVTREGGLELFFLPFDARMAAEREYRVFCAPGDGRIAGVSQYRWYKPWRFRGLGEQAQEKVVRAILEGAEAVRGLILEEVERRDDAEDRLMMEQGFSFDLFYDEDTDRCSLVELNTFGVRSACGSCLFQWVDDRKVLYGEEEAEFRVAVDMLGPDGAPGLETVRVSSLEGEDDSGEPSEFCGENWRGFVRSF